MIKFILFGLFFITFDYSESLNQEFHVDFDKNTFIKDGQPFRYISGSIHPYRVPRSLWQDRLDKMKAAGLNAVQVYVFWNEHEQTPGVYDFEGKNDIYTFINMAKNNNFLVILRVGPYACAEHEFGGLPWWLLSDRNNPIIGRSSDPRFIKVVQRYYSVLFPPLRPLLYNNGGPVIMVQIENEYGWIGCDLVYLTELRDIFRQYLGDDTVYFTTDAHVDQCVKCGKIPGVFGTIDFGPGENVTSAFDIQRMAQPDGPLVNSEFWTGWIDQWGKNHSRTSTESVVKTFYDIMNAGANINFYMFHGGTNFGFSNGAIRPYVPVITSYDYDAPISEAGDITDKYLAIREAISKYLPLPPGPIPSNSSKASYGKINMEYWTSLVEVIVDNSDKCINSQYPMTFEELGQGHGFILYSTTLKSLDINGKVLNLNSIGDRAYIQVGDQMIGIVDRNSNPTITIRLKSILEDPTLNIIVENMGRLNVDVLDPKGLLSNVTLNGEILTSWTICLTQNFVPYYQMDYPQNPHFNKPPYAFRTSNKIKKYRTDNNFTAPAVYLGIWNVPDKVSETFLKTDQFSKGIAMITSETKLTNLGKYWPSVGPQHTLYLPTEFVATSFQNIIVLIEFENSLCDDNPNNCFVELVDHQILD